jgi:tetratricopeptide (TPR) repeat protein
MTKHGKHGGFAMWCAAALLAAAVLPGGGCKTTQTAERLLDDVKSQNSRGEHDKAVESATRLILLLEGTPRGGSGISAATGYFWRGYSYDLWKDRLRRGRRVSPDAGKYRDAALENYERALEKDPEFVEACFNAALIYYDEGRFDEALRYFERAAAITPAMTEARAYIAETYFRLGRYEEAMKAIGGMIAGGTREALEEARRMKREGRADEAIEVLEEAVRLYPDFPEAYGELGMLYLFRRRNMVRALYYLEKYSATIQDEEKRQGVENIVRKIREYCKP